MILRRTEDQRFFVLVDLIHEQLHAMRLAFSNLDDFIEVRFRVAPSALNVAFHRKIVRGIDVLIEGNRKLLHAEPFALQRPKE